VRARQSRMIGARGMEETELGRRPQIDHRGSFAQTAGSNATNTLDLGYGTTTSSGSYSLGNSSLLTAQVENVGYLGSGSFTQTGGTNSAQQALSLGCSSNSFGIYTFSAGSLACPSPETSEPRWVWSDKSMKKPENLRRFLGLNGC
jgi:hypothetical protein